MQLAKKIQRSLKKLQLVFPSQRDIIAAGLVVGLLLHARGYCDAGDAESMNQITKSVTDTIFSPWVRKSALAFGGGMGLFQSWSAGSIKPLLVWGGLGLAVSYVPKLIEIISKVGA